MNRRNVLKTLALGAAGLTATTSANAQESSQRRGLFRRQTTPQATSTAARTPALRPLRLGFADIHFSDADPEAWAQHAVDRKLRAVNAPWNIGDGDRIRAIVAAVERRDLVIAEVGRWVNMLADDPAQRAENLQTITDGLAAADELNARCCVCTAGSFSDPVWGGRSPRNVSREYFDYAVENARKIIDAVKPTRTKFTFEPVPWLLPNTADQYLELIRAIDRPEFAVHLDVPNMTNTPEKIWNNTALINEIFDKLGPWVVGAHFKDLRWVPGRNVYFEQFVCGEGTIDFATYLTRMAQLPFEAPLIVEHMANANEYNRCRDHLFQVADGIGVSFG